MEILRTEKEHFTDEDILSAIGNHQATVKELDSLWNYYKALNTAIKSRKAVDDATNPNYNISVGYGRKLVTTFVGYGYRNGYITYSIADTKESKGDLKVTPEKNSSTLSTDEPIVEEKVVPEPIGKTPKEKYLELIENIYKMNNEGIKTSRNGRNMAIFGIAYDILYLDSQVAMKPDGFTMKNIPKFFNVDPREVILFYDNSPEPKKKIGIRYYKLDEKRYSVEVYYSDKIQKYERYLKENDNTWKLKLTGTFPNFFSTIPIVPYPYGDDLMGVIRSIKELIDVYDILISDSLNEFDRFAHAYLIMKKFGITNPEKKKEPGVFSQALAILKRSRVFEYVPGDASISFLTKDVPSDFINFITTCIKDLIHVMSHIPDFSSKTGAIAGVAIQRLMYDFENLVSSTDPDFDSGLYDRLCIITSFLNNADKTLKGNPWDITITHKRNSPLNLQDFAQTAVLMKNAGFSSYLIADIMPDDIIPDVEAELARQKEDKLTSFENIDDINTPFNSNEDETNDEEIVEDEE